MRQGSQDRRAEWLPASVVRRALMAPLADQPEPRRRPDYGGARAGHCRARPVDHHEEAARGRGCSGASVSARGEQFEQCVKSLILLCPSRLVRKPQAERFSSILSEMFAAWGGDCSGLRLSRMMTEDVQTRFDEERVRPNNKAALAQQATAHPTGATNIAARPRKCHEPTTERPAPARADRTRNIKFIADPLTRSAIELAAYRAPLIECLISMNMANLGQLPIGSTDTNLHKNQTKVRFIIRIARLS